MTDSPSKKVVIFDFVMSVLGKGIIVLIFITPTLIFIVLGVVAIIDTIFLGRFGIATAIGLIATFGINYVIEKKFPKLNQGHIEGVNPWLPLSIMGIGYITWILLENILPPISPKTSYLISVISDFLSN